MDKITYEIVQSYGGWWHVYAPAGRWVSCSLTRLGAKWSARKDAKKIRTPKSKRVPERFDYVV